MAALLVFNSDADQRRLDAVVVVVGTIGAVGFVLYLLGRFVSFVLPTLQQLTKHAYFCLLWIIESTALLLAGKNTLRRSCSPNCGVETTQVFAHRCFPAGVNTPVSLHLQATVHRFLWRRQRSPNYGEAQQDGARGPHAASRRRRRQKTIPQCLALLKKPVGPGISNPGWPTNGPFSSCLDV
jgi:hypothetical protein